MKTHTFNNISFSENGIQIPENRSSIIEGKISKHIDRKILVEEDGGYVFKFDNDQFYLKSFYNLRTRKYTIKFVGNRKYSLDFGSIVWSKELYFPILQFKNLDSAEYHEMLQMLKEIKAVNDTRIKEAEDLDHERNQTKIIYRYLYLVALTVTALIMGIALRSYLSGNERIILVIYNSIIGCGIAFSTLMFILVSFWKEPLKIEKLRRHLVLQYIEGIFIVLVISIVFTFALTR